MIKVRYVGISLLVTVLLATISTFCACSDETQPPSSSQPPITQEPTEPWSADGVIKAEEYAGNMQYGNYQVFWRSDDVYVYIGMKAKASGFVSFGSQPGSRMKDADIILGFVRDGEVVVEDMYSTGDFGPHPPDTELGGTNDILEFDGKEEGGFTIIEFKRALNTDDDYDRALSEGTNSIIWAYGSNDSLTTSHSARGYGEIDL